MTAWRTAPMPKGWPRLRARILRRDRGICYLCGKAGADEVDHRIPVSRGGTDDEENLAAVHKACHRRKTGREAQGGSRARPREPHPGDIDPRKTAATTLRAIDSTERI